MNSIDDIFKNSETEKNLELRPELWNRMERHLNRRKVRSPKSKWLVAASLTLIISMTSLLYLNIDFYEVEDMTVQNAPRFSKEEIAGLEQVYWVPQSLFVNPDAT